MTIHSLTVELHTATVFSENAPFLSDVLQTAAGYCLRQGTPQHRKALSGGSPHSRSASTQKRTVKNGVFRGLRRAAEHRKHPQIAFALCGVHPATGGRTATRGVRDGGYFFRLLRLELEFLRLWCYNQVSLFSAPLVGSGGERFNLYLWRSLYGFYIPKYS